MTKRTQEEIDAWLNDLYLECIQKNIPHNMRTLEVALRIHSFLNNFSIQHIPEKEYALQWMQERCKPNCDNLPRSILAFYFDTEFWELNIPLSYGKVQIKPLEYLSMPISLKTLLEQNANNADYYTKYWIDCFDFEYGLREIPPALYETNSFAIKLLLSGAQNLNAATASLLYTTHNNQIIMSIRMALEMFIKSYIAFNDPSTKTYKEKEKQAKNIGHDLKKGLEILQTLTAIKINAKIFDTLELFPSIHQRYSPENMEIQNIAQCYELTLRLGVMVTRSITDRNTLN